jgi:hypothetical protein
MPPDDPIQLNSGSQEMPVAALETPAALKTAVELPAVEVEAPKTAEPANTDTPEDATMLDVHPPHEPIHTWKEYLLHMSTIVLGLLIAIGLEQSVELIHRARERQELREFLQRDTEKAIADTERAEQAESAPLRWLTMRQQQVKDALASHKPLTGSLARAPHISSNLPIDPAWGAAKSSGLLPLLTQQEVQVYSEADRLFTHLQAGYDQGVSASRSRGSFEYRYADPKNVAVMDLSSVTPEGLNHYLDLLIDEANAWDQYRVLCQYTRGAETAILAGQRDLGQVQKAELQFYTRSAR